VCIATDVAARGIDLPGLDLVVHADLPTNSETLLHRSGRTGRAGAKGVSALIVAPAEFRKAQRLLQGARVEAEWGRAPSAQEVQERDDARILEHPALGPEPGEEASLAAALLQRFGADRVAAAFVRLWREGRSAPEELSDAAEPRSPNPPRERAAFGDAVWFALAVGRAGRAEARWLLPKLCEAGGVTKDAIGAIRIQADETFVQVAAAQAHRFGEGIEVVPGLPMRRLAEPPVLERPEGPPRGAAPRPGPRGPRDGARDRPGPPRKPKR
jgi:ATP-dependent RNA helicase DeaD